MSDEYYDIDFQQKHPTVKGYWVQADKFTEMYRKAAALDKIRTEIENLTYYWCEINPKSVIDDVLQIIDNYREEK